MPSDNDRTVHAYLEKADGSTVAVVRRHRAGKWHVERVKDGKVLEWHPLRNIQEAVEEAQTLQRAGGRVYNNLPGGRQFEARFRDLARANSNREPNPDQQAMWDALGLLGVDLDDEPKPIPTLVSGSQAYREWFLNRIRDVRRAAAQVSPSSSSSEGGEKDVLDLNVVAEAIARARYERYDSHFRQPGNEMSWAEYNVEDPSSAQALYRTEAVEDINAAIPALHAALYFAGYATPNITPASTG